MFREAPAPGDSLREVRAFIHLLGHAAVDLLQVAPLRVLRDEMHGLRAPDPGMDQV